MTVASASPARPPLSPRERARRNKRIEWIWTIIPVILVMIVAGISTPLLFNLDTGPAAFGSDPNMNVDVTGYQWFWEFHYTDPFGKALTNGTGEVFSNGTLWVPQNAIVWINVTSGDVVHSFNIPQLGVRIDAIPGRINHYWFAIPAGTAVGTQFLGQCTEFCGPGHYDMRAEIIVTPASSLLHPMSI